MVRLSIRSEAVLFFNLCLGLFLITSWAATECEVTLVASEQDFTTVEELSIYCSGADISIVVGFDVLGAITGDAGVANFDVYYDKLGVIEVNLAEDVTFTSITLRNYIYTDPYALKLISCSRCVIRKLIMENLQYSPASRTSGNAPLQVIGGSVIIEQAEVSNSFGVLYAENADITLHNGSFTNITLNGDDMASVIINGGTLTADSCTWNSVSYKDIPPGVVISGSNAAAVSLRNSSIADVFNNFTQAVITATSGASVVIDSGNRIYVPQTEDVVLLANNRAGPITFDGRSIQYDGSATSVTSAWRRPAVVISNHQAAALQLSHVGVKITSQSTVTLSNVPLISLEVDDSDLTLVNVTFSDIIFHGSYPVLTLRHANASLTSCNFSNLHNYRGQYDFRPDAVALYARDNTNVTLSHCGFTNITWSDVNDTLTSLESQVVQIQGSGELKIMDSSFMNIGGSGTAIRAAQYANVHLQHVQIEGIDLRQRTGELRAAVVVGNDSMLHAEDCRWHDINVGKGESGGALQAGANSSLNLTGCTFTNIVSPLSPTVQLQGVGAAILESCTWGTSVAPAALMVDRVLGQVRLVIANFSGFNTSSAKWSALSLVESHNVNISDSYFANNYALAGGALLAQNSTAFIFGSTFYGNSAAERGGAVSVTGSNMQFEQCTFTWNIAGGTTNAAGGGAIYANDLSHVQLRSCALSANTIMSGLGGGGVAVQDATAVIVDTIFKRNAAIGTDTCGGALYSSRSSDVEVNGSTFFANSAQLNGGALYTVGPKLKLTDSMVMGNSALKGGGLCVAADPSGNSADASNLTRKILASVPLTSAYLSTMTQSVNNSNLGQLPQSLFSEMPIQLIRTTFTQNTCYGPTGIDAFGGGVFSDIPLFIDGCTFVRNTCPAGAALTQSHPSTSGVSGPLVVMSSVFRANRAVYGGGAITLTQARTEGYAALLQNTFDGNIVQTNGGALEARAGWAMYLARNNFSNNGGSYADLAGGAVYAVSCQNPPGTGVPEDMEVSPNLYLLENYFDGNTATMGGSVHVRDCNLTVLGGHMAQNRATFGGAIYAVNTLLGSLTALEVVGAHMENNSATQQGGAVYSKGQGLSSYQSNFTGNKAGTTGGAIAMYDASPLALLPLNRTSNPFYSDAEKTLLMFGAYRSTFSGNKAALSGGAIYTDTSQLGIQNCNFDQNSAGDGYLNDEWSDSGGALTTSRCFHLNTITDTNFSSNTAAGGPGGAMFTTTCFFQLVRCTLNNNTASTSGGAIASADARNSESSWREPATLFLTTCNFGGNTVLSGDGGAVLAREVNFTSYNSTFVQNTAAGSGGAVASLNTVGNTFQDSNFTKNVAGQFGGGAYMQNTPLVLVISSTFTHNNATRLGGGLSVVDANCTLNAGNLYDGNWAGGRGGALHLQPRAPADSSGDAHCMALTLKYATPYMSDGSRTLLGMSEKKASSYNATLMYDGTVNSYHSGDQLYRGGAILSVPMARAPSQLLRRMTPFIYLGAGSAVQVTPGTVVTTADWKHVQVYGNSSGTVLSYYVGGVERQPDIPLGSGVNMRLGVGSTITALQSSTVMLSPGSFFTLLANGEWQVEVGDPIQPPDSNNTAAVSVVLGAQSVITFPTGDVLQLHGWNRFLLLMLPQLGSLLVDMEQGAIRSLTASTSITVAHGSPKTLHYGTKTLWASLMNISVPSSNQPEENINSYGQSALLALGSRVVMAAATTVAVPDWADYNIRVLANTVYLEHNTWDSGIQLGAGATLSVAVGSQMLVLQEADQLLPGGTVLKVTGSKWTLGNGTMLMPSGDSVAMSLVLPAGSVIQLLVTSTAETTSNVTVSTWNRAVLVSGPAGSCLYDTNAHDGGGAASVITILPDSTKVILATSTLLTWHNGSDVLLPSAGFKITIQKGSLHDWVLSNGTVLKLAGSTVSFTAIPALNSALFLANGSTVMINDWYTKVLVACPDGTYLADTSSGMVAMLTDGATISLTKGSILFSHDSHTSVIGANHTFTVADGSSGSTALLNGKPLILQPGERWLLRPVAPSKLVYNTEAVILADGKDVTSSQRYVFWGGSGAGGSYVLYDSQLSISYLLSSGSKIQLSGGTSLVAHTKCTTVLSAASTLSVLGNGTWLVSPGQADGSMPSSTFSIDGEVVALAAAPAPQTVLQFDQSYQLNTNGPGQHSLWGGRNGTMLYDAKRILNYLLADGSQVDLSPSSTIQFEVGIDTPMVAAATSSGLTLRVDGQGNWALSSNDTIAPGEGIVSVRDALFTLHVPSVELLPGELGRTCEVDLTDGQYQQDPFGYDFEAVETLLMNTPDADYAKPNLASNIAMAAYGYSNVTTPVSGYNATLFIPGVLADAWDPVGRAAGSVITCTATVVPAADSLAFDINALILSNTLIHNAAGARGGAMYMDGGEGRILLDSLQVVNNSVVSGDGGGMALLQDDTQPDMSLQVHVVNSTFSDNTAPLGSGGGVALTASGIHQQVEFINSTLERNSAIHGGALALSKLVSVRLANSSLVNNFAGKADTSTTATAIKSTSVVATATAESDITAGDGGAILATSCNELQIVDDTRLLNNTATGRGGALVASSCAVLLVEDSTIEGNSALSGGGMYLVNHLMVTSAGGANKTTASTGADESNTLGGSIAVVASSHFLHNEATGGNTTSIETVGMGGGILVRGHVSTLLSDSNFERNIAQLQGGSIFIESQCDLDATSRFLLECMVLPTAFDSAQSLYGDVLTSLQWPRPKGCWGTVVYLPHFYNNEAERSGGALFASHPEALSLVCDNSSINIIGAGSNVGNSIATADSTVNLSEPYLAELVLQAMKKASYQLLDNRIVQACYREELQRLLNTSMENFELSGAQLSTLNISENRARGYGYLIAIVPSKLNIVSASWAGRTTTSASPNTTVTSTYVPPPPAMPLIPPPAVVTDAAVIVAMPPSSSSPLQTFAAVGSQHHRRQLLQSTSVSGGNGGDGSSSKGLTVSPILDSANALQFDDDTQDYRKVINYHLTTTSNKPMDISMLLLDALDQIASENTTLRQAQVRARLIGFSSGCYAELVGSTEAVSRNGSATLTGMRLLARKGVNYSVELRVEDSIFAGTVEPLVLNVTIPPCALGEVPREEGYICQKCDPRSFSLWQDTAPLVDCQYPDLDDIICLPCPDAAECPGGAIIVPRQGFWHSAANSTYMNACPNPNSCRDGDDDAQDRLVACQLWWYSQAKDYDYQAHVDRILSGNYTTADDFDPSMCALWGLQYNHPLSYSQLQCAEGYSGNLCAVCTPVDGRSYAGNADFNCAPCFNRGVSIMIGVLGFTANVLTSLLSVALTFMTDYTEQENLAVGDLFKVLVVHMQFFVIVTRLNIQWPHSISFLTSLLSAVTGAVSRVYSPSCMLRVDATPAEAARVNQLVALVSPLLCTLCVAGLWLLARFLVFKFPSSRQPIDMRTVEEYREERARKAVNKRLAGKRGLEREITGLTTSTSQLGEDFDRDLYLHATLLLTAVNSTNTVGLGSRLGAVPTGTTFESKQLPHVGVVIQECEELAEEQQSIDTRHKDHRGPPQPFSGGANSNAHTGADSGVPPAPEGANVGDTSYDQGAPLRSASTPLYPSMPTLVSALSAPVPRSPAAYATPEQHETPSTAAPLTTSRNNTPRRGPPRAHVSFDNLPASPFGALRRVRTAPRVRSTRDSTYSAESPPTAAITDDNAGSSPFSWMSSLKRSIHRAASSIRRRNFSGNAGGPSTGLPVEEAATTEFVSEAGTGVGSGGEAGGSECQNKPSFRRNPSLAVSWFRKFFTYNEEAAHGKGRWASLANIHRSMAWWRQELLVVMIACFLLYPAWAQATLQIFACYVLDDSSGTYPENQLARWNRGYWILNMNQECYTGEHSRVWVPVGVVGVLVICLGIPALNYLTTYTHRTALRTVHVVQTYGFLYIRYNHERGLYGWEAVMQLQTLILVVVDVFGRVLLVYQQAVLLLLALMTILWSNMFFRPLKDKLLERMSSLSYVVLAVTVALSLFFVQVSEGRKDPITTLAAVSIGGLIVSLNLGLIVYFGIVMFANSQGAFNQKMAAAHQRMLKATIKMQGGISVMRRGVVTAGRSLGSLSVRSMGAIMVKVYPSRRRSSAQPQPTA